MIRVNYPGINKNNQITQGICEIISKEVLNDFNDLVCYNTLMETAEGYISTIVVDKIPEEVKLYTILIEENHNLGRFVDIDVYDLEGKSLSRVDFGYLSRKCYLCDSPAIECVRTMKHKQEDIISYIDKNYREFSDK
jgi:holo-ACP synthase